MTASDERKWVRFDDDQWDIITSVGYTALVVAAWRALHTASPHPLARDDYAKDFVTASADPSLNKMLADGPGTSDDSTVFPRLYGAQTRFFDDFFRSANAAGVRQAVILAAGLDSRAYRLEWAADTTVFEVDQSKVLEFKARVVADRGATPTALRKDVAADLRHDWSVPLRAAGFDPEKPTAWSVEGLLPYLTGTAQDALFSRIDQLSASRSHLAVGALGSHFDPDRLGAIETDHPEFTMSGGVDFSALTYGDDDRTTPARWLAEHRWSVHHVGTTLDLQDRCGRTAPDIDAAVDQVLNSGYLTAIR